MSNTFYFYMLSVLYKKNYPDVKLFPNEFDNLEKSTILMKIGRIALVGTAYRKVGLFRCTVTLRVYRSPYEANRC
jgi:hypothetical protein